MEKHSSIIYEGCEIHYRQEGERNAQTIVLLHGFMQSLEVWNEFMLCNMGSMRIVSVDLPGHGYSECHSEVHTMEFMAKCVKEVLDYLDISLCVIVGHSLGGYVALAFADLYPHLVKGLALLNSHALADNEETKKRRDEACRQIAADKFSFSIDFITNLFNSERRYNFSQEIKEITDLSLKASTEGLVAAQKGMKERPSRLHTLETLKVPILFVYGKKDPRIALELGLSQSMLVHRGEVLILDDVAHMSFIEESDYVCNGLVDFVHRCYSTY